MNLKYGDCNGYPRLLGWVSGNSGPGTFQPPKLDLPPILQVTGKRENSCFGGFPVKNAKDGFLYEPFGLHKVSASKPQQELLDPKVEELLQLDSHT